MHCPKFICVCLVLNRFQLPAHNVYLRVRDGEDVAVCLSRARGVSFDLELHAILCVDEPLAVAVQGCARNGSQIDEEAELVAREIFGQVHVGPAVRASFWLEETADLPPHFGATDALVVDPVGNPVDCDLHFGDVRVKIVFGIPGARHEGVDEQQEDALEGPAQWVHPNVQPSVIALVNWNHPVSHCKVVGELLAVGVCACRLVGQTLTPYRLVLQLHVFQLVHELACVRACN